MKILVLCFGNSLAHVTRPLEVVKELRQRGHQVIFAGCGRYLQIAKQDGFEIHELPFISEERTKAMMRSGRLQDLFSEQDVETWVQAELALYKEIKPDLLIVDTWITASTSAELAKLKRVTLINAHMTLFKKVPFLRKTIRDKSLWDHFINRMGNLIEATFYHVFVVAKVNRVRRRYGLKGKFSFSIEQGDLTLLTDIPDFNPTHPLPENIKYIGPLSWHNSLPAPACLDRLDKSKKTVYVTIGSLGSEELVAEIQNLKIEDIQFVLSTGGAAPPPPPSAKNVFTESFVNAEKLLPHCHGILCHGGNGTIYQALAHGLPVVGISIHDEQYYGLKAVNDLGLGKGFSAKEFKTIGLKEVLKELASVLDDQDVHERVLAMQSKIKKYHAAKTAADLIENYSPAPTALASFNH